MSPTNNSSSRERTRAELAYYRRVIDLAALAARSELPVPVVPPREELEFVDRCLVWKGRPIWPTAGEPQARPVPVGREKRTRARAAQLSALERRLDVLMEVLAGGDNVEHARVRAVHAYYRSLGEQADRAMRGEALVPVVPPASELEFVDGWLIWKGRPVWWSGYRPHQQSGHREGSAAPRECVPPPSTGRRPKRRFSIRLPWRRAA